MVEYAGWEMPLYYSPGATEEHRIVRRSAGLFDVSHMGRFSLRGPESCDFLNHVLTCDVPSLKPGHSCYGLMLKSDGGILDDIFLYHQSPENYILVVNASNLDKDWKWLEKNRSPFDTVLEDRSSETSLFALQGPEVIKVLEILTGQALLRDWDRFGIRKFILQDISFSAGRTGYTGEDGVEIFVENKWALSLWNLLLLEFSKHCEISPCGLASRDSLRFEPGFPLYGHELSEQILPPQALLKWACHMEGDFIGKQAVQDLLERGLELKLVTLCLTEKGVPREGYEVLNIHEEVIGRVVSGLYAPTVDKYCANAYLPVLYTKPGTELLVSLRGRHKKAIVEKRPLYKPAYR